MNKERHFVINFESEKTDEQCLDSLVRICIHIGQYYPTITLGRAVVRDGDGIKEVSREAPRRE